MEFLLLFALVIGVVLLVVPVHVALGRHSARMARSELALRQLQSATFGLTHRVCWMEAHLDGSRRPAPWPDASGPPPGYRGAAPNLSPVAPAAAGAGQMSIGWEPVAAAATVASNTHPPAHALSPSPELPHPVQEQVQARAQVEERARVEDLARVEERTPQDETGTSRAEATGAGIDWERWLGIRGAAALGAGILVIALVYFLRYSVDQGWLSPARRVGLGGLFAAACIAAGQLRLRGSHPILASWLTGAGIAGLYACVWAAQNVVGLIGPGVAFGSMLIVTAGCVALALRNDSLPVALLGLSGAFAAPLCLAIPIDRPYGVLAYVVLLDVATLVLAIRKRWWVLAGFALLASALYEAVWINLSTGTVNVPMHVGILTVFAGLFAAVPPLSGVFPVDRNGGPPFLRLTQYAALLVPFGFAALLVANPAVVAQPAPIGVLLIILTSLGVALARARREPGLLFVAALGDVTVLLGWIVQADLTAHAASLGALLVLLAAPFLILTKLEASRLLASHPRDALTDSSALVATLVLGAFALLALGGTVAAPELYLIHLGTLAALGAGSLALSRVAKLRGLAPLTLTGLAAAFGGVGVACGLLAGDTGSAAPEQAGLAAALLFIVGSIAVARTRPAAEPDATWSAELLAGARGASLVSFAPVLALSSHLEVGPFTALVAVLCVTMLAASGPAPGWYVVAAVVAPAALTTYGALNLPAPLQVMVSAGAALLIALCAAPFVGFFQLGRSVWAARGQAIAIAAFAVCVNSLRYESAGMHLGALTASGALLAVALLMIAHRKGAPHELRPDAWRWLATIATIAGSAAIALTFEREQLVWAWCLLGLAMIALNRKLGHAGLRHVGLAHIVYAATRLISPSVLDYHPRGELALLNWITPTFLLPVAACSAAWWLLRRAEEGVENEPAIMTRQAGAVVAATIALVLGFAWLNVAVLDIYGTAAELSLAGARSDGRDLAISVVWGLYGAGLLVVGLARRVSALRWASLGLMLITAAKVFLYDLSHLTDLYRVAALAGLAVSLFTISMLYQRLVFRPTPAPAPSR